MDQKSYQEELLAEEADTFKLPLFYRKLRKFELDLYNVALKNLPGGEKALDIGCGNGLFLLLLRQKYREVWGVDVNKACVTRIEAMLNEVSRIHVREADASKRLDFEDNYFDAVAVLALLPWFLRPRALLRECERLLSPSGTLVIQVPNLGFLPNRVRILMGRLPATSERGGREDFVSEDAIHYFTRSSAKRLLQQQGFNIKRITSSGIFAKFRSWWGTLLSGDIIIVATKE